MTHIFFEILSLEDIPFKMKVKQLTYTPAVCTDKNKDMIHCFTILLHNRVFVMLNSLNYFFTTLLNLEVTEFIILQYNNMCHL